MMPTIDPFLKGGVFGSKAIAAMTMALDDVCKELEISAGAAATREIIAMRIIELARQGERSPTHLRDRVLEEARFDGLAVSPV
jgi:hypothetical protein